MREEIELGRGAPILASLAVCLAMPAGAGAATETFEHTGAAQTFPVPAGVTELTLDAYGGAGGNFGSGPFGSLGGLGGRATATIPVTPGEALEVNVGGAGANAAQAAPAAGGFNGGGDVSGCGAVDFGAAGGGASDLRRDADGTGGYELDERLVVAGGGGGADDFGGATGGSGGGTSGGNGGTPPSGGTYTTTFGGTQDAGGAGGTRTGGTDGQPGELGAGADSTICAGAGGGGLYGGGSGATGSAFYQGGGGGSGFTPEGTGMTNGVRSGNGQIVLTYTAAPPPDDTSPPPDGATPPPDGATPPAPSEFTRTLSIAHSEKKDKFQGRLASQSPACISGQKVTVFEKSKGKDPKLGSDASLANGKYSLNESNAEGKFYAQVKQTIVPTGTCVAAKSETIKVG